MAQVTLPTPPPQDNCSAWAGCRSVSTLFLFAHMMGERSLLGYNFTSLLRLLFFPPFVCLRQFLSLLYSPGTQDIDEAVLELADI